jgi:hypothetical protein
MASGEASASLTTEDSLSRRPDVGFTDAFVFSIPARMLWLI